MNKEIISDKQAISIMILFIWGSTLVIGTGTEAKRDMWLAKVIAIIAAILISFIYIKILSSYKNKDIFEINEIIFGKVFGKLLNLMYSFFAFILAAFVLNNFTEFISNVGLPDTPKYVPVIFIVIICIWGVKEGIEVLGRWSEIFVIFLTIMLIFSLTLSATLIDIENVRPVLYEGLPTLMKGSFSAFAFPFGETIIFTMIFNSLKSSGSAKKVYLLSIPLAGIILVAIAFRNIAAIGVELSSRNYFPAYVVVSRISVGEFIQRIETVVTVTFLVAGFMKVCCCLLATCRGVAKIFNFKDYRFITTPMALMAFAISFKVYDNIIETVQWVPQVYPYYSFLFEIILPAITFIGVIVKNKSTKPNRLENNCS